MELTKTERIRRVMKTKGLTGVKLAQNVGVTAGAISQQLQNGNIAIIVYEYILSTYPDINPDWLLLGNGEMYRYETPIQPVNTHAPARNYPEERLTTLETALVAMTTHLSHQDRLIDKLTDLSAESQERMMSVNKIVEKLSEIGTTFADHMRTKIMLKRVKCP